MSNCAPSVSKGILIETEFSVKRFNWQDTNLPLTYEFALGEDPITLRCSIVQCAMTCFLHNFRRTRYFTCTAYEGYDSSYRNFLSPDPKE